MLLSALVFASLFASTPQAPAAKQTVVTTLSAAGAAALALELEAIAPSRFEVKTATEYAAVLRFVADPSVNVVLLYGLSLAELQQVQSDSLEIRYSKIDVVLPDASTLDAEDRTYGVLFADAVVLAIDRARTENDLGRGVDTVLPTSLSAIASGRFEGAFFASTPTLSNAAGAIVGRLAFEAGKNAEDALSKFGVNLAGRETQNDGAALDRTTGEGPPTFALVTESAVRKLGAATRLEGLRVFGSSLAVVRGLAWIEGRGADSTLIRLLEAGAVARVADAERLVPMRGPESGQLDANLSVRRALEMEGPRIALETTRVRDWVPRYSRDLRDRLGKKRQRFEDVYDVVLLCALAIAGGWLLLRRKPADDAPRR